MDKQEAAEREAAKTAEQQLQRVYEQDYRAAPRVAEAMVREAQAWLLGTGQPVGVGQQRVLLASAKARSGQPLGETVLQEVVWTVDNGAIDARVRAQQGSAALRRVRIQRLLEEAYAQGALATQEDLARVLQTSLRTIKRDCARLKADGVWLTTRGQLKGIGRGQTHKAQIITRWLQGETFDQLERNTHHSPSSIRRYLQGFVQVIQLQQRGYAEGEISQLARMSQTLVREYLTVYAANDSPACRERLAEQLARLSRAETPKKGAP